MTKKNLPLHLIASALAICIFASSSNGAETSSIPTWKKSWDVVANVSDFALTISSEGAEALAIGSKSEYQFFNRLATNPNNSAVLQQYAAGRRQEWGLLELKMKNNKVVPGIRAAETALLIARPILDASFVALQMNENLDRIKTDPALAGIRSELSDDLLRNYFSEVQSGVAKAVALKLGGDLAAKLFLQLAGKTAAKWAGRSLGVVGGVLLDPGELGARTESSMPDPSTDPADTSAWLAAVSETASGLEMACKGISACIEQSSLSSTSVSLWQYFSLKFAWAQKIGPAYAQRYAWVKKYEPVFNDSDTIVGIQPRVPVKVLDYLKLSLDYPQVGEPLSATLHVEGRATVKFNQHCDGGVSTFSGEFKKYPQSQYSWTSVLPSNTQMTGSNGSRCTLNIEALAPFGMSERKSFQFSVFPNTPLGVKLATLEAGVWSGSPSFRIFADTVGAQKGVTLKVSDSSGRQVIQSSMKEGSMKMDNSVGWYLDISLEDAWKQLESGTYTLRAVAMTTDKKEVTSAPINLVVKRASPPAAVKVTAVQPASVLRVGVPAVFKVMGDNLSESVPLTFGGCVDPQRVAINSQNMELRCIPKLSGMQDFGWKPNAGVKEPSKAGAFNVLSATIDPPPPTTGSSAAVPVNILSISANPASVMAGQAMTFSATVDNASDVQRAELFFPDANVTEPMAQSGNSFSHQRTMTAVAVNRPFIVRIYKKSNAPFVARHAAFTVQAATPTPTPTPSAPTPVNILSISANPASVMAGQPMTFSATVDNASDVQRAELFFPDANVTEPMAQTGNSFSHQRTMTAAAANRPFIVRIYKKSNGPFVARHATFSVQAATPTPTPTPTPSAPTPVNILSISANPASVMAGQPMTFRATVDSASDVQRAELVFPDANVTEPMAQSDNIFSRQRTMTATAADRPFEVRIYKRSSGQVVARQGVFTVQAVAPTPTPVPPAPPSVPPVNIQNISANPASVVAGQPMTFSATVDNASDVQRAELVFPDANVTEPMAQSGNNFSRQRTMSSAALNRPFEVRIYKKSNGQVVARQGTFTVQAAPPHTPTMSAVQPQGQPVLNQSSVFLFQGQNLVASVVVTVANCDQPQTQLVNPTQIRHQCTPRMAGQQQAGWKASAAEAAVRPLGAVNVMAPPPAGFKITSVSVSAASVAVGQPLTFGASVDDASDVLRAELVFPDANVAEPMTQNGTSFSHQRVMSSVGANRVFEVRIYKKSGGQPVVRTGSYSVQPVVVPPSVQPTVTVVQPQGQLTVGQQEVFIFAGQNLTADVRVTVANCDQPQTQLVNPTQIRHQCIPRQAGQQQVGWKASAAEPNMRSLGAVTVGVDTPVPTVTAVQPQGQLTVGQPELFIFAGQNLTADVRVTVANCDQPQTQLVSPTQIRHQCTPRQAGQQQVGWKANASEPNLRSLGAVTVVVDTPLPVPTVTAVQPQGQLTVGQQEVFLFQGQNLTPGVVVTVANCDQPQTQLVNPTQIRHQCTPRQAGQQQVGWKANAAEPSVRPLGAVTIGVNTPVPTVTAVQPQGQLTVGQPEVFIFAGQNLTADVRVTVANCDQPQTQLVNPTQIRHQ